MSKHCEPIDSKFYDFGGIKAAVVKRSNGSFFVEVNYYGTFYETYHNTELEAFREILSYAER